MYQICNLKKLVKLKFCFLAHPSQKKFLQLTKQKMNIGIPTS